MNKYLLTAALFMLTATAFAQQTVGRNPQHPAPMPRQSAAMTLQQSTRDLMRPMDKPSSDIADAPDITADAPATPTQKKRSISIGQAVWRHIHTVQKDAEGNIVVTQDNVVDAKGNYLEKTSRSYDNGKLTGGRKNTYAYNDYGNLTEQDAYTLDPKDPLNGDWLLTVKHTFEYDADQNTTKHLSQTLDMYTQELTSGSRTDWTYNDRRQCTSQLDWTYKEGSWTKFMYQTHDYDEFGSMYMHATLSGWDNSINGWTSGEKSVELYKSLHNASGTYLAVNGGYEWDSGAQDWKIINEYTYDYDDYDRPVSQKELHQDSYGKFWGTWFKFDYLPAGKVKRAIYSWNDTNNEWALNTYYISTYDENGCNTHTEGYDGDNCLLYTNDYTWQKITLDPITYPDIFFVGSETQWAFLAGKEATDLGGGTVEWKDITIKKGDEFKFASDDWTTFNWGTSYGDQPIPVDQDVQLTGGPSSRNITLDIQADEVRCESIRLDVVKGIVHIKTAPTGVSDINAAKARVEAKDGCIRVTGARRVAVYNANGSLVGNTALTAVEPGIYVVKADGKTVKVAVK